jgi:parallel beta-helix repeat protein
METEQFIVRQLLPGGAAMGASSDIEIVAESQSAPPVENTWADTVYATTVSSMAGNFDVGGGNNDYPTIIAAIQAVVTNGVGGPIIFNVYDDPGPYDGQVDIPALAGSSPTNTVTIRPAPGEHPVVTNTIGTSSTTGNCFYLTGGDYITIRGMEMTGCYYHGIYNYYSPDSSNHNRFISNYVHDFGASVSASGIYLYRGAYCDVIGNEIDGDYYGINNYYGEHNFIANNMVYDNDYYGIRAYSGSNNEYYHNSVLNSTHYGIYHYAGTGTIIENNIFYQAGSGSIYAFYNSGTTLPVISDYNDLYAPSANVGYYSGAQATLADWQAATGLDANSISADPLFVSMTDTPDLHITIIVPSPVDDAGTPIASVTIDIDGDARDPVEPDIGCDEFEFTPMDYCVMMDPETQTGIIGESSSLDYMFYVENCGDLNDTYNTTVTVTGEPWTHEVRDATGTTIITELAVNSGATDSFLVRVITPAGISLGDQSFGEVMVESQGGTDDILRDTSWVTTTGVVPITLPYFEDFDVNDGGYTSGGTGCWEWGNPTDPDGPDTCCSEPYCWGTILAGDYPTYACCYLDTPPIDLVGPATMTFCNWWDTENAYDGGNVKISTDGGSTWSLLTPLTGYPSTTNSSNACIPLEPAYSGHTQGYWETQEFDLTPYAGTMSIVRFAFGSDGSVQYPGWFIDNMDITAPEDWCVDVEPEYQVTVTTAGSSDDFTLTATNCGLNTDTYEPSAANVPANWTATFYDATGTTVIDSIGPLTAGASADFIVRLTSDPSVVPGNYPVDVIVDSRYGTPRNTLSDTVMVEAIICPIYPLPYSENFDYGGNDPPCWTIIDGGSLTGPPGRWHAELESGTDYWMVTDSDAEGSGQTQDEQLITPTIDCSGASVVFLDFWHYYYRLGDVADVDISISGGPWQNVISYTASYTGDETLDISTWAANQSDVQIRWHYQASYDWWWIIDDVEVYQGVEYDAGITCIRVTPTTTIINDGARMQSGAVYDVFATVENHGGLTATNTSVNASDDYGWASTVVVPSLAPGVCQEVQFPNTWTGMGGGMYNTMTVTAVLTGDTVVSNDTETKSVTVPGADGDTLIIDDGGPLVNAWHRTIQGDVIGAMHTPTTYPAQINWVSAHILCPGDPYWPWPDPTQDQLALGVWLEDPLNPGYPAEPPAWYDPNVYPPGVAVGGWLTVAPDMAVIVNSGSFWVGFENLWNCASMGQEGIGLDAATNFTNQNWCRISGTWQVYNPYAGDLMIRANILGAIPAVDDLVIGLVDVDLATHATLTWSAVPGAVEYKIYKSTTDPNTGFTLIDSTANLTYTDNNAVPGVVKSFYYVTASDVALDAGVASRPSTTAVGPVRQMSPALETRYQNATKPVSFDVAAASSVQRNVTAEPRKTPTRNVR